MCVPGFAGICAPRAAFPAIAGRKWPRSLSTTAVALFFKFCLCSCTSRCVLEVGRQEVATLVVNSGSGAFLLVLLVFMHLALCSQGLSAGCGHARRQQRQWRYFILVLLVFMHLALCSQGLSAGCGHARRQQRQWHYFTGFCLSSCTSVAFPTIAGRCTGGVMPQIMDIVMGSCDVELVVASCHRSWGHREGDVAFSCVEQIVVPAVMDVPVVMQRRCVATLDVPQIQFIVRVYRHSSSQCNGSAGFGGDVGAFRGSSAFFVLLLLELSACQLAQDFVDIHIASP